MRNQLRYVVLLMAFLLACQQSIQKNHVERNGFLMDTVIRISLYDSRSENTLETWADQLFTYMLSIEKKVSVHLEGSDPQQLIAAAGNQQFVNIGHETEVILKEALGIFEQSKGAFDVTIGPLKTLWGFDSGTYRISDSSEIKAYLDLGNFQNVDVKSGQARITSSGLEIDLGGIAKGYILDAAVLWLKEKGVQAGMVEGGGDLRVFGPHPRRDAWRIGVQDPRNERGSLVGVVSVKDQSIATSGDYERFFIRNGQRYHHILDPKTGFPSQKSVSVTIIAPNALLADAYATAVFVMGPEAGIALLDQLPGIEGLIFYESDQGLSHVMSQGAGSLIEME